LRQEFHLVRNTIDVELRTALFQRWSREQLQGLSAECRGLASPVERLYIAEVRRRYSYLRQFAPRLSETFVLRAVVPNEPLLRAVTYLRERNRVEVKQCGFILTQSGFERPLILI
jgi:hypothetical protein